MKWIQDFGGVDKESYTTLFGNNVLKSYELLQATHLSDLSDIEMHYLKHEDDKNGLSIIPCFVYKFNLEVLTVRPIKKLIHSIRVLFPSFLKVKIFFVGTPIAICDHLIGISSTPTVNDEFFSAVFKEIKDHSKRLKASLIVFKEIPAHDKQLIELLAQNEIIIGKSLPNSYLFLDKKLGNWTDSFRKKYRQRIRRQIKQSDAKKEYQWDLIKDFGSYTDMFEALYLQVLERSEYKFEKLNKDFFKNVNKLLPTASCALVCTKNDKIVCFELILEQGDTCIPIYLGIDYEHLQEGDLYFSCINKLIVYAEENGFKKIKFGQTSYPAKAYVGSIFEELFLGVFSTNYIIQKFLRTFSHLLFSAPEMPNVTVYRQEKWEVMTQIIQENNIINIDQVNT